MSIPGITSGSTGNVSGTAPLLGSKVSLISQAEIRYEGILYTVDPAEKTIALAKGFLFCVLLAKKMFNYPFQCIRMAPRIVRQTIRCHHRQMFTNTSFSKLETSRI